MSRSGSSICRGFSGGYPQLAALLQVMTLLELFLPEVAAHDCVAMLVNAIGEVLASHADHAAFPALQVSFLDVVPFLHEIPGSVQVY